MPRVILFAVCLGFVVVVLGAYTRLTHAGLGCPDWPGCYGHMVLPQSKMALNKAQMQFPSTPIEAKKAWTEMAHRYVAGCLGLCILLIAGFSLRRKFQDSEPLRMAYGKKRRPFPVRIPLVLVFLLVFQALLGMWTVTLKLLPVVVMGHLLGGMSIVCCLLWCRLSVVSEEKIEGMETFKPWAILGLVLVIMQIALGGWVSSNYAGVACVGFPQCNGQWLPKLNMIDAFNLFSPIGNNYQGGLLDIQTRITIQFVHRIGALVVASYLLILSWLMIMKGQPVIKRIAGCIVLLVLTQFTLGVINVVDLLPLSVAVAHNGVALLLLLTTLTLVFYLWQKGESCQLQ